MTTRRFPNPEWQRISPAEAGMNAEKLERARRWQEEHTSTRFYRDLRITFGRQDRSLWRDAQATDGRYRVVIVRGGAIAAEWNNGVDPDDRFPMFSARKSVCSSMLGIAIEEGKISSADAKLPDYFPEFMDVPPGTGPKPDRYAFEKDREITFRQLISNTSGYMKPGEAPGEVFHYQSFGMNVLTHAIARAYGLYDTRYPAATPGYDRLVDDKICTPIGANWRYIVQNFDLAPEAHAEVFGYSIDPVSSVLDMARLGWLWCSWGRWKHKQIIPEWWMREATRTAPDILAHCPEEMWKYGHAFWTNDHGQLFPDLPRDSYAALGMYGIAMIWVCPSLDLVVAHNPGLLVDRSSETENRAPGLLRLIVDACG